MSLNGCVSLMILFLSIKYHSFTFDTIKCLHSINHLLTLVCVHKDCWCNSVLFCVCHHNIVTAQYHYSPLYFSSKPLMRLEQLHQLQEQGDLLNNNWRLMVARERERSPKLNATYNCQ